MEIRTADLALRDRYKLLIGGIVPRPIAFISTMSPDGVLNLAPFSFFTGVGSDPMTLMFCPGNAPGGGEKDTLLNAQPVADGGTGEFVVNVATEDYAREVSAAAEVLPPEEDEFELTGLETAPSKVVAPPRVARSPLAFECRTLRVLRLNPGKPGGGNIVIGDIVHVFVDDAVIDDGFHIDPDALRAIGRMGGPEYVRTQDRFALPRGRAALKSTR